MVRIAKQCFGIMLILGLFVGSFQPALAQSVSKSESDAPSSVDTQQITERKSDQSTNSTVSTSHSRGESDRRADKEVEVSTATLPAPSFEFMNAWGGPVNAYHLDGDTAYIAAGQRVIIGDASDLENIREISSVNVGATIEDMVVIGDYAYAVTISSPDLVTVDISDKNSPQIVSQFSSPFIQSQNEIDVYGNLLYITSSIARTTRVYDISNPANPINVACVFGNCDVLLPTPSQPVEIEIVGNVVYMASKNLLGQEDSVITIRSYDLSVNPLAPTLISALNLVPPGHQSDPVEGFDVEGGVAYLIIRDNTTPDLDQLEQYYVRMVNVVNPANMDIVGDYHNFDYFPNDIKAISTVSGGYVYITDHVGSHGSSAWDFSHGLMVFETNGRDLTHVGDYKTHATVRQILGVQNNRVIVSDAGEGLVILDTSDPEELERIGNFHSPAEIMNIEKHGNLLFVSDAWNGFTILDSSKENALEVLGIFQSKLSDTNREGPNNSSILYDEEREIVFLSAGREGVQFVDVSDPTDPVFLNSYGTECVASSFSRDFRGLALASDNVLYAGGMHPLIPFGPPFGCGSTVLLKLDISDIHNIQEIADPLVTDTHQLETITLDEKEEVAFLGQESGEQVIVDISGENPSIAYAASQQEVRDGTALHSIRGSVVKDDVLYAIGEIGVGFDAFSGLVVQDVSDPTNPVVLSTLSLPGAHSLDTENDRAYIKSGTSMKLVDISDPKNPTIITSINGVTAQIGGGGGIKVDEPYVFVSTSRDGGGDDRNMGMKVYKVNNLPLESSPANIDESGSVDGVDLGILLNEWGSKSDLADLNNDGVVDGIDLGILLGSWDL